MKHSELMKENHKKVNRTLNCFEYFLIFISAVSRCLSIHAFAFLVGIPTGITGSAVGLKICAIIAGIKKYNSIIKENRKKV